MSGIGNFLAGFGSGSTGAAGNIMEKQRLYDMDQAAKAAELERKESFARFQHKLEEPQRQFTNKMTERRVAVSEGQLGVAKDNFGISKENLKMRKRDQAVNEAQLSSAWGIDPETGKVRQLTRSEAASGKYKMADPKQVMQAQAQAKVAGEDSYKEARFNADLKKLESVEPDPKVREQIIQLAKVTGTSPMQARKTAEQGTELGIDAQTLKAVKALTDAEMKQMGEEAESGKDYYELYDAAFQRNLKAYAKKNGPKKIDVIREDVSKKSEESKKQKMLDEYKRRAEEQQELFKKMDELKASGNTKGMKALQNRANKNGEFLRKLQNEMPKDVLAKIPRAS